MKMGLGHRCKERAVGSLIPCSSVSSSRYPLTHELGVGADRKIPQRYGWGVTLNITALTFRMSNCFNREL